jgi:hypothetical protein
MTPVAVASLDQLRHLALQWKPGRESLGVVGQALRVGFTLEDGEVEGADDAGRDRRVTKTGRLRLQSAEPGVDAEHGVAERRGGITKLDTHDREVSRHQARHGAVGLAAERDARVRR